MDKKGIVITPILLGVIASVMVFFPVAKWFIAYQRSIDISREHLEEIQIVYQEYSANMQQRFEEIQALAGKSFSEDLNSKYSISKEFGLEQTVPYTYGAVSGEKSYIPLTVSIFKKNENNQNEKEEVFSYSNKIFSSATSEGIVFNIDYPKHAMKVKYDDASNSLDFYVDGKRVPSFMQLPDFNNPTLVASTSKVGAIGKKIPNIVYSSGPSWVIPENGYLLIETSTEGAVKHFYMRIYRGNGWYTLYHTSSGGYLHADSDLTPVRKGDLIQFGHCGSNVYFLDNIEIIFYPIAKNQ